MNISRSNTPEGLCVLTFDRPNSSANVFDRATLHELDAHLTAIASDPALCGVVLVSAKPKIFIAGADLNAFATETSDLALAEIVDLGHGVFGRLAQLTLPTVAAIHGTCLGGGLELALACDWRLASPDKATKLGLPETQLGILPAWGGSTRLPKLIGLPKALGLILTGKQLAAEPALKLGLVDDIAPREDFLAAAGRLAARGKRPAPRRSWTSRMPASALIAAKARRDVLAKTRGHYPAPMKAIEVCTRAVNAPLAQGLASERAAFLELIRTPVTRNLLSVFFLQERAKKLAITGCEAPQASPSAVRKGPAEAPAFSRPASVRTVGVLGAGTMGAGIAQWISARGHPVRLKDVSPEALARGLHAIEKVYTGAVKRRVFTRAEATAGMDRITPLHVPVPLHDVDLVIEAALEKLEVKQQVFYEIERLVRPDAVLATNTSALSIDAIASALRDPSRLVGLHFFNPVHRMQLVEIVHGPRTSPATLASALQFTKAIGKLPVLVRDSPGFLVNRILLPYLVEAVWLFTEGMPAEQIDTQMLGFGMPMGPLRLCDEVGLDVAQHVAKDLERRLRNPIPINDTLERMVAKGWLGKKSGRGFYVHDPKSDRATSNTEVGFLQANPPRPNIAAAALDRMVLIMVNEAARVLEERVVDAPEDVDFGMIMGTGWAPFRGGPLRYADSRDAADIVRRLVTLTHEVAPHFRPCERLREMASTGRKFYLERAAQEKLAADLRAAAAAAATDRPLATQTAKPTPTHPAVAT